MQNKNLLGDLEIYIPVEAEVKSIPMWSLPKSVLKGMGLPMSDWDGTGKFQDSPEGVWICPAVIRRKGQKRASHTEINMMEYLSSLLGRQFRAVAGPFQMSFVSANHTAFKVLNDTMPGKKLATNTPSHVSLLPHGSATQTYKDAVVIYREQIYLSCRKSNHRQHQPGTHEPRPASQCATPSTSELSSKSLKKRQSPQASLEPADKDVQRKKMRATLPQTCPGQLKGLQELLNNNVPKRTTHGENKKGSHVSSTTAMRRPVPPSTECVHNVDSRSDEEADEEQAEEEKSAAQFQRQREKKKKKEEEEKEVDTYEGDCETQDLADGVYVDSGSGESSHNTVGVVEQSSNQTRTRRKESTSLQGEFDFSELAKEEKIAQMKAKLRQSVAHLDNLNSS